MKNLLFLFLALSCMTCKKKEEPPPVKDPAPLPPPPHNNEMSATINGNVWLVQGNGTPTANILQNVYNGTPKQYVIGGRTGPTINNSISLGFAPVTGTFDISGTGNYYAIYQDSTGFSYSIKSGTLHILSFDTSHVKSTACDKFKANFSFITNAILGKSYTVTAGTINFEAN